MSKQPDAYTEALQSLALAMSVTCVRNTVIEDYHCDGKLTDDEMMAFNKEVADNIYTFLHFLIGPGQPDAAEFIAGVSINIPSNWDKPQLVKSLLKVPAMIRLLKESPAPTPKPARKK